MFPWMGNLISLPNYFKIYNSMKHLYFKLMMSAFALLAIQANAADVDVATAQSLASRFVKSNVRGRLMSPQATLQLAHVEKSLNDASIADFYVFNTSDGAAFVIVAGDDRAEQILGYGNGPLDMATIPANVKWWLDGYKRQIEHLRTIEPAAGPRPVRAPSRTTPVEPMLTSSWSQGKPYNDMCPEYQGEMCATGCIATALAQVMYYWKYPAELPPLPSFVTSGLGFTVPALPGTRLDWDNMIDKYERNYTAAQGAAVAVLMRYCGQACYMDYTPEGSGAYEEDQLSALKRFGYSSEATFVERDMTPRSQWESMLQEDLSAGRPVLYTGTSYDAGHAFVLDGYDGQGKYHVNWGWGGSSDGYFALDALGTSSVYADLQFNYYQKMLHGVCPQEGTTEAAYDLESDGLYFLTRGDEATVTLKNHSYEGYSGDVVIPATVTSGGKTYRVTAIGDEAFMNCSGLTSVTIPEGVTTIGRNAFRNCQAMTRVHIGPSVNQVGNSAFGNCMGLKTVEVEDVAKWFSIDFGNYSSTPLYYADHFVAGGEEVKDLVIPGSAKRIGNSALMYSHCFNSVTIEDGVTAIGEMAFSSCQNLKSVSIPGSVRNIDYGAFLWCEDLEHVTLGEGVASLGEYAFYECTALKEISIPGSVKDLGLCAFTYCANLESVNMGEGVENIAASAFYGCSALQRLTLPTTVKSIGYASFVSCKSMKELVFAGDADIAMDVYAFYDCSALERLSLPSGQRTVSEGLFYGCNGLTEVSLGNSMTNIAPYAFYGCNKLTGLAIPSTVSAIGSQAFAACGSLSRVDISDLSSWCRIQFEDNLANPLTNAHHLYVGGEEVTELTLPAGLAAVGKNTFSGASALTRVSIPASVKQIEGGAFKGCTSLKRVDVPDLQSWMDIDFAYESSNPVSLAHHLYVGGEELTSLVVPDGLPSVGAYAFYGCEGLTRVEVDADVTAIGSKAFRLCSNLAEVVVGDGVKEIGDQAFATCTSLKRVSLGEAVEAIGSQCFSSCLILADVTCKAVTPPVLGSKNVFAAGVYKKSTLSVPASSVDAYKNATFWSQFVNVEPIAPAYAIGDVNRDGEVNVSDVNTMIAAIYDAPDGIACYDMNGDGSLDIADVNALIDLIIQAH